MKIIKKGKHPDLFPRQHTCYKCKTVFMYDRSDMKEYYDARDGYSCYYVVCPLCNHTPEVSRPL